MGIKGRGIVKIKAERTSGDYVVKFIDYDGTVLKSQYVNSGETANVPTIPTHDYLTFNSWNYQYTNITQDTCISTTYDTTDGKSYLFITLTNVTGVSPIIYLNKSNTASMTIEWGDTTTSTSTSSGNFNLTHTYSAIGNYIIKISCLGNYNFGNGTSTTAIFKDGLYKDCLTKLYVGKYVDNILTYGFYACKGLLYVSLPVGVTTIGYYSFYNTWSLIFINFPYGLTTLGYLAFFNALALNYIILPNTITFINTSVFPYCYSSSYINIPTTVTTIGINFAYRHMSLTKIIIPPILTYIPNGTFYLCDKIKEIILPNTITSIGTNSFYNCNTLEYLNISSAITSIGDSAFYSCKSLRICIINAITPPTLININAFYGINDTCKIYVPDGSVSNYKGASQWITYANYIYSINDL